jgi:hypothetical protein
MIADDQRTRRELETVAFGRVVTAADEDAAARALQALRELDERVSPRAPEAGIPAADVASGPVTTEVVGVQNRAQNRVTGSLRRFWVVPVVIASIAVGAIGGSWATRMAAASPTGPAVSRDTTVVSNSAAPQPPSDADGSSAEDWLGQPRRPIDTFPDEQNLVAFGVDPNSTHVVRTEGTTHFWIARGSAGSLCLVMMATSDGNTQVRCVPPELFPELGVSAEADDGTSAYWSPEGVVVSDPVPRSTE